MNLGRSLFALLVFPGLLYALPMGWLMLGLERRLKARCQGRFGPPLSQPFYDTVKLFAKWPLPRVGLDEGLLTGLPILAAGSMIGALGLLPVFASDSGFAGDLILLVGLLEMPPLCLILAGYASRSIYGEVGATREALISIASNVPFLAALVAMATSAGSLRLLQIATATPWAVRVPALLTMLICLPVKLRLNPFSLANAEQELLAGPLTEFEGPRLAMWEIAHALEWTVLTGLLATTAIKPGAIWFVHAPVFVLLSLALVVPLTLLAASTARLKINQATRLLWHWGGLLAMVSLAAAFVIGHGGH